MQETDDKRRRRVIWGPTRSLVYDVWIDPHRDPLTAFLLPQQARLQGILEKKRKRKR